MQKENNKVIRDFGREWEKFNYNKIDKEALFNNFQQYFRIFPWEKISLNSEGFDMGCGSARWAQFVAPKVKILNCIEPSKAIEVAKETLKDFENVRYLKERTDTCSLEPLSQDFGYCLGVLHHIPDTQTAIKDCAKLLKKGAPFLVYVYYNFENRPTWFRILWLVSDILRRIISKLPRFLKHIICEIIAILIYFPIARFAKFAEKIRVDVTSFPLSDYRTKSFYQMRNDSLDRFGTSLEKRFSKQQIKKMLLSANFERIKFSDQTPYWCCVAYKK